MKPALLAKDSLIAALARMTQAIQEDDTIEGSISYERAEYPPDFKVQAFFRVGNSEGQGSSIMIGEEQLPSPARSLAEVEALRTAFDRAVVALDTQVIEVFLDKKTGVLNLNKSIDFAGDDFHDSYVQVTFDHEEGISLVDSGDNAASPEDLDTEIVYEAFAQILRGQYTIPKRRNVLDE